MGGSGTFFKVDRKIFESDIWLQPVELRLFIYLIGQARHSKKPSTKYKSRGIIIERGQVLKSYRKLREELEYFENNAIKNYSLSRIKTAIDRLKGQNRIKTETTQLGTIFTVVNYLEYQGSYTKDSATQNGVRTECEQTENNTNNVKNVKNDNNGSNKDTKDIVEKEKSDDIPYKEIVDYLNQRIGTHYRHTTKKTKRLIRARWSDGFRLIDFKTVIEKKAMEWLGDEEMEKYLRPPTLFGTKFESYLNQISVKNKADNSKLKQLKELYAEAEMEEGEESDYAL